MKLALMSDIHANLQAFEACLEHAQAQGATRFALLGDLVGYGADPAAVVQRVMELKDGGAVVLQGNHDAMAVSPPVASKGADANLALSTAQWTHDQLSPVQRQFLAQLPLSAQDGATLFVHANAHTPEKWIYVDSERTAGLCLDAARAQEARRVFVGHVHHQGVYYLGAARDVMHFTPTPGIAVPMPPQRTWVATIGSVGQPRDGNPRAMYALYEAQGQRLTFHRVAYDVETAAAAIRRAGLPEYFAHRLEDGR